MGALRPVNMSAAPQLASALLDFSFLAIAMGSFLTAGVFAGFAVIALREGALWPRWLGWLAVAAALFCTFRVGAVHVRGHLHGRRPGGLLAADRGLRGLDRRG